MRKIFPLNPPFQLDLDSNSLIGDVFVRVDAGADNTFEAMFDFFGSSGTWDEHLMRLLQAAGKTNITTPLQAVAYMQSKPAAEMEGEVLTAFNNMLKDLGAVVNRVWKRATGQLPADAHQTAQSLFGALLARTQAGTDAADQACLKAN